MGSMGAFYSDLHWAVLDWRENGMSNGMATDPALHCFQALS